MCTTAVGEGGCFLQQVREVRGRPFPFEYIDKSQRSMPLLRRGGAKFHDVAVRVGHENLPGTVGTNILADNLSLFSA